MGAAFCTQHDKKPRLIRALISRAERSDLPQGLMRPGTQKKGIKLTFYSASRSWPCASLPGGAAVARFSARAAPRALHVQPAGFSPGAFRCFDFLHSQCAPGFLGAHWPVASEAFLLALYRKVA